MEPPALDNTLKIRNPASPFGSQTSSYVNKKSEPLAKIRRFLITRVFLLKEALNKRIGIPNKSASDKRIGISQEKALNKKIGIPIKGPIKKR